MDAAIAQSTAPERGSELLLTHCRTLEAQREPALVRLSARIGGELAVRLVQALSGSHPPRFGELS